MAKKYQKKTGGSKKRNSEPAILKYGKQRYNGPKKKLVAKPENLNLDGSVRLNKYLAQAGICSRREADELIKLGTVTINGQIVTEMGTKVKPGDVVKHNGEKISHEKLVYILMNKPKNYIATLDDGERRNTVLDLLDKHVAERVYPVGRLDRNTTGVLLLTNDGDLALKLTHPKHEVKKIYQVSLDKAFAPNDFTSMQEGLKLEDGFIKPEELAYVSQATKKEVGIEIHSGKNNIVRRMFEAMGYKVTKLDRVFFGGLTKKNLPRGKWRHLEQDEVNFLKMLG